VAALIGKVDSMVAYKLIPFSSYLTFVFSLTILSSTLLGNTTVKFNNTTVDGETIISSTFPAVSKGSFIQRRYSSNQLEK